MVIFSQSKPKHLFFLLGSLIFLFSLTYSSAQALTLPQIFFDKFNINKNNFDAGGTIEGDFTVWNAEESVIPDITYRFNLSTKDEQGNFTVVRDDQPSGINFSLLPDQTLTKSFSYQLPKKLSPGDYKFTVQLYNSKGIPMAWQDESITINKTDGGVLDIQNGSFIKDGGKPGMVAFYNLGEAPKIAFEVANKSFFKVKAYPKVSIYAETIGGELVQEIKKDYITLEPGKTQGQEIDLAALSGSNVYIARVIMYDQDNNPVSSLIDFQWTILNEEGAGIIEVKTDKSSYNSGDSAKVSIDLSTQSEAAKKGDVSIKITNGEEVVGQVNQEIDLKAGKVDVWVPINKDVSNPGIETVVTDKQNGILDQSSVKVETGSGGEKKENPKSIDWALVGGLVSLGIAAVIAIIYFFLKKKKAGAGVMIFILAVTGLFLGGPVANAKNNNLWIEYPNNNINLSFVRNEPSPKNIYSLGGYVNFSGKVSASAGSIFSPGLLKNTDFEFFIGDSINPVLKDEVIGGDTIKVINVQATKDKGGHIESLGKGSVTDTGGAWIGFNKGSILIPNNNDYLGKSSRFYVQFKGHKESFVPWGKDSWLSNIAYLTVEIQKNKEGGLSLDFNANATSASPGDIVKYTIDVSNDAPCATVARPIDVILVLDRSGSMNFKIDNDLPATSTPSRMDAAKAAIEKFLTILNPNNDKIGLVSYSSDSPYVSVSVSSYGDSRVDASLTNANNYQTIKSALNSIVAVGGTCISCGINTAKRELNDHGRDGTAKYIILLTDGGANISLASQERKDNTTSDPTKYCYAPSAQDSINQVINNNSGGTIFYTVGFSQMAAGIPPSPTTTASAVNSFCNNPPVIGVPSSCCGLMNAMADKGKGTYSYAQNKEELIKIYEGIAGAIVGQSFYTDVTVEIPDGLSVAKVDGRCVFNEATRKLTCLNIGDKGFLDCDSQTKVLPIEFEAEVDADTPDGDLEIKATISNQINQEKAISFKLKISSNKPDAEFSCDPSGCDIDGCSSPDCCRCYNDKNAVLKLINKSTPQGGPAIKQSIWSIKEQGSVSYRDIIIGPGIENCSPQNLAVGKHIVKLKVVNEKGDEGETTREITYLQGAKAGFSCSLDKGATWYGCEDKTHIYPNQGATIWLSDNRLALEHSILSDGAIAANVERDWYMVDADGNKTSFNTGKNNSTVSMVLNRLPAIIGLELNDKNRPPISKEHKVNVVALPGWKEISPF